ncbi:MAG: hybrid sensor histidine kinase/response regulator [Planctomycetota bacterium]
MNEAEGCRILLLEDDPCYRSLFIHALARQAPEHEVDFGTTVAEVVAALQERRYDAVVSDLNVPDSSGLETISRLRECARSTPIIALTGDDNPELERQIFAVGAQDYLVKGYVGSRDISRAIHHAVERQHSVNEIESLASDLAESHALLKRQAELLQKKNVKLKRMNELAGEFVDNVSHDLRTPLTVITDYVGLIREGVVGEVNDQQAEMLRKVAVRADDLNNMVDDLLDVSKLDAGMLGCWRRTLQPHQLFEHVRGLLQQRAEVVGVELNIECPDSLPEVFGDAEKATRTLTNLAVNAIKFTGRGGSVLLTAEPDDDASQVIFAVHDNGPGIAPEKLERLFGRFEQEKPAVAPSGKGFGLGLSIARKFARMNLGDLLATSTPGEGSTFQFTMPYAKPTEVFSRWLNERRDPNAPMHLITINVPSAAGADDFDQLLTAELRQDDLLIRVRDTVWSLVLEATPDQFRQWRERLNAQHNAASRNRPAGVLPTFRLPTVTEWGRRHSTVARIQEFRERAEPQRVTPKPHYAARTQPTTTTTTTMTHA